MCLQQWLKSWFPKKLLMETIYLFFLLCSWWSNINSLFDCWIFINVDVNGNGLVTKSSLVTIEIYMVSHSHSLGERPSLQKSALGKIQLYQALRNCLEMNLSSNIFYKPSVCADSKSFKKQLWSMCHMSYVICHMSHFICHMSFITCHLICLKAMASTDLTSSIKLSFFFNN